MSNVLNEVFASVFIMENLNGIPRAPVKIGNNETLRMISVTERDVARCMKKLTVNTTPT